jgi:hypothetical protein
MITQLCSFCNLLGSCAETVVGQQIRLARQDSVGVGAHGVGGIPHAEGGSSLCVSNKHPGVYTHLNVLKGKSGVF